jgi:hypothetical protein
MSHDNSFNFKSGAATSSEDVDFASHLGIEILALRPMSERRAETVIPAGYCSGEKPVGLSSVTSPELTYSEPFGGQKPAATTFARVCWRSSKLG